MFASNMETTIWPLFNELPQWGLKLEAHKDEVA
jgi:hypothetical protein